MTSPQDRNWIRKVVEGPDYADEWTRVAPRSEDLIETYERGAAFRVVFLEGPPAGPLPVSRGPIPFAAPIKPRPLQDAEGAEATIREVRGARAIYLPDDAAAQAADLQQSELEERIAAASRATYAQGSIDAPADVTIDPAVVFTDKVMDDDVIGFIRDLLPEPMGPAGAR